MRKFISLFTVSAIIMSCLSLSVFAAEDTDYQISNPYAEVNWEEWGQYKANLHTHTTASDGHIDFADMIQKHYALDYDFLAITDHSTTCYSWTEVNYVPAVHFTMGFRNGDGPFKKPTPLTQAEYEEITTSGKDGKSMLPVPFGNEQNGASFNNTHVCSWFADYGNGVLGATSDYETALENIEKLGGLCVINHPGEYTGMKDETNPEKAYEGNKSYYVTKFAELLKKYPSCLGIDINSKTDNRTKNDRKLWDLLLQEVIPSGRNVFALATSDAHRENAVDSGWTIHLMPEKNIENLRASMESGAFFAASHFIKNTKELAILSSETGKDLGSSWEADTNTPAPKITNITVDDTEDTISLTASNAATVHWIANGEVIAVGESIDLDEYADKIGSYVRAEVFGDGGILYTQAFTLSYENAPTEKQHDGFYDFGTIFKKLYELLMKIIESSKTLSSLNDWFFG